MTPLKHTQGNVHGARLGQETSSTAANNRNDEQNDVEDDEDTQRHTPPEEEREEDGVRLGLPVRHVLLPVLRSTTRVRGRIPPDILRTLRVVPGVAPRQQDPIPVTQETNERRGVGEVNQTSHGNQLALIDHRPNLTGTLEQIPLRTTFGVIRGGIDQTTRNEGNEYANTQNGRHDVVHNRDTH